MLMHGEEKGVIRHSEVSLMRMWCVHMPEVSVSKRRSKDWNQEVSPSAQA